MNGWPKCLVFYCFISKSNRLPCRGRLLFCVYQGHQEKDYYIDETYNQRSHYPQDVTYRNAHKLVLLSSRFPCGSLCNQRFQTLCKGSTVHRAADSDIMVTDIMGNYNTFHELFPPPCETWVAPSIPLANPRKPC